MVSGAEADIDPFVRRWRPQDMWDGGTPMPRVGGGRLGGEREGLSWGGMGWVQQQAQHSARARPLEQPAGGAAGAEEVGWDTRGAQYSARARGHADTAAARVAFVPGVTDTGGEGVVGIGEGEGGVGVGWGGQSGGGGGGVDEEGAWGLCLLGLLFGLVLGLLLGLLLAFSLGI